MEHKFIVIGPIDGFYHLGYLIPGTDTYSSVVQFSSEAAAHREAGFMESSLNHPQSDK